MDKDIPQWKEFACGSLDAAGEVTFRLLAGDGSTRRFYRVGGLDRPAVLMVNPGPPRHDERGVDENETWVYLAGLFRSLGAGAPEVYRFAREAGLILIEDLGDRLLQQSVEEHGAGSAWTAALYRRLLDTLLVLQVDGFRRLEPERLFNRDYDPEFMFRWEGMYFATQFAGRLCGHSDPALEGELARLAAAAGEWMNGQVLIYRDFQSRNVMLGPRESLRLVDFQGARPGPPSYDVSSLLFDPYVQLGDSLRLELIEYYHAALERRDPDLAAEFSAQFQFVAAHRIMQALGAYAKLALTDGKTEFLRYAPHGLADLRHLLEGQEFAPFTVLRRVVARLEPPEMV
ncbi:phosphotransferase [bacterium]|nr:phosphotransferase [bacterium]